MQTMYNQSKFYSNLLPSTGTLGVNSGAYNVNQLSASKNDIQLSQPHSIYKNGIGASGVFGTSQQFIPAISSMPVMI